MSPWLDRLGGMTQQTDLSDSPRPHGLSKSRVAAFEQCPKRLWLQVHRPELAEIDGGKSLRFAAGHEVGEIACALHPQGIMIDAEPDLAAAAQKTAEILADGCRVPLFEATFVHEGVLVRLDIMEPHEDGSWHVAEVKSATSRKDCYVPDLATQLWVLRANNVRVRSAAIRHVNNQFVLEEEGQYEGLLVDVDSLAEAHELLDARGDLVAAARDTLSGDEPVIAVGDHCNEPYSCEFSAYCAELVDQPEWPISLLPNTGRKLAAKWAEEGIAELTDVPAESISNANHKRIHEATCSGIAFHDPVGAQRTIADWAWPRSYLDFETIAFAVPRWLGTRPWQQVPFQFSLHIEEEDGALKHREFLCLGPQDPRRAIAEALIKAIPGDGIVIAYNASFERGCIKQLITLFPDLADELEAIAGRIVDLLPVTRNHWYHRDQRGSWSIKAVLPTIGNGEGYAELAVADGSAAQAAYLEASDCSCEPNRRAEIEQQLRGYCALDTEAMVRLLHHLVGAQEA